MLRQPDCLIMLILSLPIEGDSKCSLTCNADPIPHYYSTAQNWVCRMKRTKRILNSSETFGFVLLGTKHVTVTLYLSTVLHRVLSRDSNNVPPTIVLLSIQLLREKSENFETLKKMQKL